MNREEIKNRIPQRDPFLFVDEVLDQTQDKIIARYKVTGKEEFFRGHFPDNPVLPAVIQQEMLFQTAAILMSQRDGEGLGVVTRVGNGKFKKMVSPGALLELEVKVKEELGQAIFFLGKIRSEGKTIVSLEFACALVS